MEKRLGGLSLCNKTELSHLSFFLIDTGGSLIDGVKGLQIVAVAWEQRDAMLYKSILSILKIACLFLFDKKKSVDKCAKNITMTRSVRAGDKVFRVLWFPRRPAAQTGLLFLDATATYLSHAPIVSKIVKLHVFKTNTDYNTDG